MRRAGNAFCLALCYAVGATGCGNTPRAPDWQITAHDALQRYVAAFMSGDTRVELAEFGAARTALASTGQAALVARAELTRCAARVATLDFAACDGFERLRQDAPAAERAYADYLAGQATPADAALLPSQHRAAFSAAVAGADGAAAIQAIEDPFARLVAAGVLLRAGRADPRVLTLASDTASAQGWRRPLLAWLGVQVQRAERAGAADEAQRLRRRMQLAGGVRHEPPGCCMP